MARQGIGLQTSIGDRSHRVQVENPSAAVPDGDGSYTQSWAPADPPGLFVAIRPATTQDLERAQAGTVVSTATHVLVGPFHSQISTRSRLLLSEYGVTRVFYVLGVGSPDLRATEVSLLVAEALT